MWILLVDVYVVLLICVWVLFLVIWNSVELIDRLLLSRFYLLLVLYDLFFLGFNFCWFVVFMSCFNDGLNDVLYDM